MTTLASSSTRATGLSATQLPLPRQGGSAGALAENLRWDSPSWDAAFGFVIPGRVVSKSNHRADARSKWAELKDYEAEVAMVARSSRPANWPAFDLNPSTGARDAGSVQHPRVVVVLLARTMLDAGNLSKSILDACQGVLYSDDAHVAAVCDVTERTTKRQGLLAAFAALPATATTNDVLAAQCSLLQQVAAAWPTDPLGVDSADQTSANGGRR